MHFKISRFSGFHVGGASHPSLRSAEGVIRQGVILARNLLDTRGDFKLVRITSFTVTEIKAKVRTGLDCTTPFRGAIALADDFTLRVQPFYESCEMKRGAPQGIEIAPASDFGEFRGLNPSPASTFPKISSFPNFRVHAPDACARITFLIRNAQR